MAQTGYTPILIYSSSTGGNAPAVGNLTNSTLGSELAINITDGKLFYKDNANAIQVIGWKVVPTSAGGTGLTSYTAGDLLYYASGTTLTKLGIGAANTVLTSSGSAPQWSTNLNIGSLTATSISDSGNLTFTGTGNRITGDFSNATVANRVLFQTSTANVATTVSAIPNGTDPTSVFSALNASDPTNAGNMSVLCTTGESSLRASRFGTGTFLPMTFYTGGSEVMRIFTSGGVSIGNTTDPGASNLYVNNDILSGTSATTGSASNVRRITGGRFSTVNGSGFTANSGVATTMFTLTNTSDSQTWLVSADLQGESATSYACVYVVTCINNSVTNATLLVKGSLASISVSGLNVQYTQSSGGTKTNTQYSAIRIM